MIGIVGIRDRHRSESAIAIVRNTRSPSFGIRDRHRSEWRSPSIGIRDRDASEYALRPPRHGAAFFAADAAKSQSGEIAVWAVRRDLGLRRGPVRTAPVQVLEVPQPTHSYLHAQGGLFTWVQAPLQALATAEEWPDLVGYMDSNPEWFGREPFHKFTLPSTEAPELHKLHWAAGVSKVHLMPTLDNVKKWLGQRWSDYSQDPRPPACPESPRPSARQHD